MPADSNHPLIKAITNGNAREANDWLKAPANAVDLPIFKGAFDAFVQSKAQKDLFGVISSAWEKVPNKLAIESAEKKKLAADVLSGIVPKERIKEKDDKRNKSNKSDKPLADQIEELMFSKNPELNLIELIMEKAEWDLEVSEKRQKHDEASEKKKDEVNVKEDKRKLSLSTKSMMFAMLAIACAAIPGAQAFVPMIIMLAIVALTAEVLSPIVKAVGEPLRKTVGVCLDLVVGAVTIGLSLTADLARLAASPALGMPSRSFTFDAIAELGSNLKNAALGRKTNANENILQPPLQEGAERNKLQEQVQVQDKEQKPVEKANTDDKAKGQNQGKEKVVQTPITAGCPPSIIHPAVAHSLPTHDAATAAAASSTIKGLKGMTSEELKEVARIVGTAKVATTDTANKVAVGTPSVHHDPTARTR